MGRSKNELAVRMTVVRILARKGVSPEKALAEALGRCGGGITQEAYAGALARVREVMDAPEEQPEPEAGQEDVTPYVRREFLWLLSEREVKGLKTYGTTLETSSGRDVLRDVKEECTDLWQYLSQCELERDGQVLTGIHCPVCGAVVHNSAVQPERAPGRACAITARPRSWLSLPRRSCAEGATGHR